MQKLVFIFIFSMLGNSIFAQCEDYSSVSVKKTIPESSWFDNGDGQKDITFSDGTTGRLFKSKQTGKIYIQNGWEKASFYSYSDALKALWLMKKCRIMPPKWD